MARGFFRLWIVLSGLWVAAFAVGFVNDYNSEPYVPKYGLAYKKSTETFDRLDSYSSDYSLLAEAPEFDKITIQEVPELLIFAVKNLEPSERSKMLDKAAALAAANIRSIQKQQTANRMAFYPAWALTPPLVLLVLGWLTRWVIMGFKKTRS